LSSDFCRQFRSSVDITRFQSSHGPPSLHSSSPGQTFSFHKSSGYDLLNPPHIKRNVVKHAPIFGPDLWKRQKAVIADIENLFPVTRAALDADAQGSPCPIASIHTRIEHLVSEEELKSKDAAFKMQYLDLFPPDVPDVVDLPSDVLMNIKLKDELKPMVARAYSCPGRRHPSGLCGPQILR